MILAWQLCLPLLTGLMIFANHYSRDSPGAVEMQLADPPLNITPKEYGTLNSVYFIPNIITPVLCGFLGQRYGASTVNSVVAAVAAVGHLIFSIGIQTAAFPIMLVGRAIVGLTYESLDVIQIGIIAPLLPDCWDIMAGVINGFTRLGSVCNFIITPIIYNALGIKAAMIAASIVGASTVIFAVIVNVWDLRLSRDSGSVRQRHIDFQQFSGCFWLYVCCGAFLYGSIVPFWFYGSKYIQLQWGYSLADADFLTLLPEGVITVVAPMLGLIVKKGLSARIRLFLVMVGAIFTAIMYTLIALGATWFSNPLILVVLLGVSYSISNFFFWSCVTPLSPRPFLTLAAGITGGATNILPGFLPYIISQLRASTGMFLLAVVSIFSALAALAAMFAFSPQHSKGDPELIPIVQQPTTTCE